MGQDRVAHAAADLTGGMSRRAAGARIPCMRLGFAVKVLGAGGLPSHDTRRWQSGPHLSVSLHHLEAVLDHLAATGIRMYRMATALAPYASHPDLPQFRDQPRACAERLAAVGARARAHGVRLSTHPGQYTVLNSEDERVVALAVEELEVQAEILDGMGLGPEAVVVLHVGGAAGGPAAALDRFARGFERLSDAARARLVVENDDRSFALADVLRLSERIGRPVVWDVLHHHCHDPQRIPDREALALAAATWPAGVRPKVHFSSPRTDVGERRRRVGRRVERTVAMPPLRAHADLVDPISFEHFVAHTAAGIAVDVMLEAKAKDLALLRLREQLAARGFLLDAAP
jgi:UV DNA damage endonuclease